jgi:hypothetical protein
MDQSTSRILMYKKNGGGQWAVYEAGRNSLPPAMNNRVKWEVDQLKKSAN